MTQQNSNNDIVGRCFVIFSEDEGRTTIGREGIVRAVLPGERLLVQFFDAFVGEPSTMAVVPIATVDWQVERKPGAWEFFEDDAHLRHWQEHGFGRRYV